MGVFCPMLEQYQQNQKACRNLISCEWFSFPLDKAPFCRNTSVLFCRNRLSNLTDEFWPLEDEVYNDEAVHESLVDPEVPAQEPGFVKNVTVPVFGQKSMESFIITVATSGFQICIYRTDSYFHSTVPHLPSTGPRDGHSFQWMRFSSAIYFPQSKIKAVLLFTNLASRLAHDHEPLQDDGFTNPVDAATSRVTTIPISFTVLGYTAKKIEPGFRGVDIWIY